MAFVPSLAALVSGARTSFLESAAPEARGAAESGPLPDAGRDAPGPSLSDGAASLLRERGEKLLRRARDAEQPVAMLVMHFHDLDELRSVFGGRAAEEAVRHVATHLADIAGPHGLFVRACPDTFVVLLPHARSRDLMQAVHARFGPHGCLEFECDGEELVLVPDTMARTLREGETAELTCQRLRRAIRKVQRIEQQRRQFLRWERESHTGTAELPP